MATSALLLVSMWPSLEIGFENEQKIMSYFPANKCVLIWHHTSRRGKICVHSLQVFQEEDTRVVCGTIPNFPPSFPDYLFPVILVLSSSQPFLSNFIPFPNSSALFIVKKREKKIFSHRVIAALKGQYNVWLTLMSWCKGAKMKGLPRSDNCFVDCQRSLEKGVLINLTNTHSGPNCMCLSRRREGFKNSAVVHPLTCQPSWDRHNKSPLWDACCIRLSIDTAYRLAVSFVTAIA